MVSKRQRGLIVRGLLTIVDRGKTVIGIAPTNDVKEISSGATAATRAEDSSRLSQKAAAQTFPSQATLKAAGAPLILTTSGFDAFKERAKQGKVAPAIEAQSSAFDKLKSFSSLARFTDPFALPGILTKASLRGGAAAGVLAAGVPPQQVSPLVFGSEAAIARAASAGVQSVAGPQGLIGPGGLVGPTGPRGIPGATFGKDIASAALGRAGEGLINVVLPDQGQPSSGLFDIGAGNKVLIGLALVLGIVFLGKK